MDDFSFLWDIYLTSVSHLCFQKTYNQQNWVGSTSRGADSHLTNPPDLKSVITVFIQGSWSPNPHSKVSKRQK